MKAISEIAPKINLDVNAQAQKKSDGRLPDRSAYQGAVLCRPDCDICGGMGWVRYDVAFDDPKFGQIEICPNSDPFARYASQIGLPPEDHNLTWANVIDYENTQDALFAVRETVQRGYGWVTLWGDYGLAKSLILKIAVVMATREIRKPCSYVRMAELIENMRSAFDADNPSETSQYRLDWWSRVPVLAIDELDRLRNTPYADEQKFIVMDRRYEDALRKKTVTLIAMNSGPLSIDGYLADRMLDGRFQVIHLEGQSARPMMRYKGGSRA